MYHPYVYMTEWQGIRRMVPITFRNMTVSTVVDAAAQITVISPDLLQKLKWVKPVIVQQVDVRNAQKAAVLIWTL